MPAPMSCLLCLSGALIAANPAGKYLGQPPPGTQAVRFAPGRVNAGPTTRDMAIRPDGRAFYFSVLLPDFSRAAILVSRRGPTGWTEPEVAPFSRDPRYRCLEPCISPDGTRFFFATDRPLDPCADKPGPFGIWSMVRVGDDWGPATPLGPEINGAGPAFYPSVTRDGTLYFTREGEGGGSAIFRARPKGEGFAPPERLPAAVNSGRDRYNAFVAPEEDYVIVPVFGAPDTMGGTDYYIVFRDAQDRWSRPINLGEAVNTAANEEYSPYVSPDGKWFFFMSQRETRPVLPAGAPLSFAGLKALNRALKARAAGIYWMEAGFLQELRGKAVFAD